MISFAGGAGDGVYFGGQVLAAPGFEPHSD